MTIKILTELANKFTNLGNLSMGKIQQETFHCCAGNVQKRIDELKDSDELRAIEYAEDALALWEYALESQGVMAWLKGDEGSCHGRSQAVKISPMLGRAYEVSGFPDGFDWDFLPWFFEELFDLEGTVPTPDTLTQELANAAADRATVHWNKSNG